MQTVQTDWKIWAQKLQRTRLNELIAVLLETGEPLNLIAAQFAYFCQPFWTGAGSLAHLLEDSDRARAMVKDLRIDREDE